MAKQFQYWNAKPRRNNPESKLSIPAYPSILAVQYLKINHMAMPDQQDQQPLPDDGPPPILKTWNRMYLFVLILHAIIITLFYWFTQAYS
ncbi:hypothetical protein [Phaeodactylibacter xiamenensis]|uniref:hypothetical protein n=1 Tax=Phaeodactylibacter xiamenensis TaxID=1524460 RepID=UPI003BA9D751